jgi:hypothetical protein
MILEYRPPVALTAAGPEHTCNIFYSTVIIPENKGTVQQIWLVHILAMVIMYPNTKLPNTEFQNILSCGGSISLSKL